MTAARPSPVLDRRSRLRNIKTVRKLGRCLIPQKHNAKGGRGMGSRDGQKYLCIILSGAIQVREENAARMSVPSFPKGDHIAL